VGVVTWSAMAGGREISGKYLEQVVGALRRANLIVSRKGVRGGYTLGRPPADITLWDVISALDSHTAPVDCVAEPQTCDRAGDCLTRSIWTLLDARLKEFWTSFTLEDLVGAMRDEGHLSLQQLDASGLLGPQ